MDQSNSAGRAGSNVRMRLFQPRGNDNPGDDEVQSRQSNRNDMQANGYDVRNNSEVELQLSDSELVPEDSGRESTVDGVESASISLLPLAQVRSPVDESNILESNVQGSEQHLDGAMVVAESFSGNDTSELDIDSGRLAEAAALIRSSPGGFADERDPNYATQRPDTLGAITIAEVTQGAATGGMQSRYTGAPSTLRSWMADSAVEGASFADNSSSAPRLGRRTRGAGMDQVELNQRYLLDDDDDNDDDDGNQSENDEENSDGDTGSDLGDEDDDDNRLRNANQCESTEADQYKMEPEVDQSDGIELSGRTPPLSAGNHQEVDAALPNGLAQNDLDHVNRLDRFGHDNVCGDARDVDKAEEDQNPSARQLLSSAHQSRAVHVSHLGASSSVHEPDGASRKCTVSQQQHSQTVSASTVKIGASVAKTCPIGAAGCGGSKLGVGGSSDVTASAFKPVTSARAVSSHEASVIPGQQSKVAGKQVLTMNLAAARHGNLQHAVATTNRQGVQVQPPVKQNSAVPVHKLPNEFSTSSVTMSDPMVINESYTDQHDPELASHEARMQKRTGIPPVGADLRQSYLGPIASRDDDVRSSRDKYEGSGPDLRLDTQNAFVDIADYTLANSGRNAAARAPPVAGARESPAAIGSFIPGDSSSQQATPVRIYTHLPHQLLDDSLEMSPIRPASSAGSQHTSLHALETASVRGDHLNGLDFVPFRSCGHQVSSDMVPSEINEMEELRGQLNQLLLLSERNIPDKAVYDHTNDDIDDLLTGRSGGRSADPSSYSNSGLPSISALHDVWPLSSKVLMQSVIPTTSGLHSKPDPAALLAENHALRDAMEQQRFKLKHCEKQIHLLQNKVLELQQSLAVSVSMERKKDIMIEQLDKALYKVVEGWKQKEGDRQEMMHRLQLEKNTLQHALDTQQQVVSRFERQLKQTLNQLHAEQQRAISVCNEKDRQLDDQHIEYERLLEELNREREQCRRLVDAEKRDVLAAKDKMHAQLAQLKVAHEEEHSFWNAKEREYIQKIDEMSDSHMEAVEQHKTHLEKQKQLYAELQTALRTTQMQVDKLQLELDTTLRERESLKVELSLAEARLESAKRKLEAELRMEAERQLSVRLDEAAQHQSEAERKIHETHRKHLQDLAQQHHTELQRLADEHEEALRWLEEKHRHDGSLREDKIQELEAQIAVLEEENKRMQERNLEVTSQLQNMMQSHCSEALRLLQQAGLPSSSVLNETSSQELAKEDNLRLHVVNEDVQTFENPEHSSLPMMSDASFQPVLPAVPNGPGRLENGELTTSRQHKAQSSFSPPVSMSSSQPLLVNSASDHFSTQYSQFLESVRGFQPLLADLNASIASVTNSVSTVGASVDGARLTNGCLSGTEVQPCISASAASRQSDGSSGVWLHSPVVLRSSHETGLAPGNNEESPKQKENRQRAESLASIANTKVVNGRHSALLDQILQQDMGSANTSGDSTVSEQFVPVVSSGQNMSRVLPASADKLRQHEMRQQELSHYIRILLQKSPGASTETEGHPVPDVLHRLNGGGRSDEQSSQSGVTKQLPNADATMTLTAQQLGELARMLQSHRLASGRTGGLATDFGSLPAFFQPSTNGHTDQSEAPNDRPSSPTKEVRRGRTDSADNSSRTRPAAAMPADSDCTKSPVKQCRQVGHSAPTNEVGVGPGRPELHVDPARQVRPLKLDAAPKVSKQPSAVPGVTSKKVDKRVQQPTNGAVKGSSRSTSTAWK